MLHTWFMNWREKQFVRTRLSKVIKQKILPVLHPNIVALTHKLKEHRVKKIGYRIHRCSAKRSSLNILLFLTEEVMDAIFVCMRVCVCVSACSCECVSIHLLCAWVERNQMALPGFLLVISDCDLEDRLLSVTTVSSGWLTEPNAEFM